MSLSNPKGKVKKSTILIIDDSPMNIDILVNTLSPEYHLKAALDGKTALELAVSHPRPDLIVLDIMMPIMDGYEVIKRLKANPRVAHIPVIFVTGKTDASDEEKGLKLGAVDYMTKPISPSIALARIKTHLALYNQSRELERLVEKRTEQLKETKLEIIHCLGRAAEFKDNETGMHVIRMSYYSKIIAESLGVDKHWSDLLYRAAPMHDIGKIGIPDNILLKRGRLNPEEREAMEKHVDYGIKILGGHQSDLLHFAKEIAETHHEKYDGSGYPHGLIGEDIPLVGRIVALADVFDALVSERPYKEAWPVDKTVKYIEGQAGQHFDPKLVDIFIKNLPEILEINERFKEPPSD